MTVFVWFGVGSAVSTSTATDTFIAAVNATSDSTLTLLPFTDRVLHISIAFGFGLAAMVASAAKLSGGHLNPAVTFALVITKNCPPLRGFFYILAQCLGAIFGAGLVYLQSPESVQNGGMGANGLGAGVTVGGAMIAEIVGTFALVLTVLKVAGLKSDANEFYNLGDHAPLLIGVVVAAAHAVMIPIDGCSINPARSFGSAVVGNRWDSHYIFWVGPLVGSFLACLFYGATHYWAIRVMQFHEKVKKQEKLAELDDLESGHSKRKKIKNPAIRSSSEESVDKPKKTRKTRKPVTETSSTSEPESKPKKRARKKETTTSSSFYTTSSE
eukprot:TRINITY_DN8374_c0_g1_i1.p1 TRINITY_DN8374_c0_g1~~TRINITY_DN8374_c0_g1_i1.p1  ORF type:complete len:348 (-),score=82.06 TRINITY_DN8374_c0_g1_i1:19-999(-)